MKTNELWRRALSAVMSALLVITMMPTTGLAEALEPVAGEQAIDVPTDEGEDSESGDGQQASAADEAEPSQTVEFDLSDLEPSTLDPGMLAESKVAVHELGQYITSISAPDSVKHGDNVAVTLEWMITEGVQGGVDAFTYQLPVNFKMESAATGDITKGSGGEAIGTYQVDTNGKVTITYNDNYNVDSQTTVNIMQITGVAQYGSDADNHEIKFEWTNGSKVIEVTNPGDFKVAKKASMYYPNGELSHDTYIDYTVDITSELGTNGQPFTITDTLSATNWSGTPRFENFSLKSGETKIDIDDLVVDGEKLTIKNVPALSAGGSYQLTYRVVFEQDKTSNVQGVMQFGNKVDVTSGIITHSKTTSNQRTAVLVKSGQDFDQNTKRVRWEINIFTQGASVAGYTVEDASGWAYDTSDIDNFRLYADEVEVARGNQIPNLKFDESNKNFSFTIPDNEGVGRWKLAYYANIEGAPGAEVVAKNSVVLKRTDTDESWTYDATKKGIVPNAGTVTASKSGGGFGAAQDGYLPVNWSTSVSYDSYSKTAAQGDYWIVDKIMSAQLQTNANVWERQKYDKDHYGIASEIQAALEQNLKVTVLENGAEVQKTYAELADQITVFYYSSDSPDNSAVVSSSDGTTHVRSFQIKIDNSVQPLKVESGYSTRFNLEHYSKGENWRFRNQLSADNSISDVAQYHKEELTSDTGVSKQVYFGTTWVSGSATVAYEDTKDLGYQMKYRLLVTLPEGESSFEVTDQLPEGLTYVDGSVTVGAYTEASHSRSGMWNNKSVSYDAESNKLTVSVDGIGSGSQLLKDRNTVVVEYKVKLSDNIAKLDGATIESNGSSYFASASLENTATVDGKSDSLTLDVTQEQKVLDKTAEQVMSDGAYTSTVHYTAKINPSEFDLLPNGDVLTLTDTITSTALDFKLVPSSVKLYSVNEDGNKGAEVEPLSVAIEQPVTTGVEVKQVFTIGVRDETAYVLEYDYAVDKRAASNAATEGTLRNTIALEGKASSASDAYIQGISVRVASNFAVLDLVKVDSKNNAKYLGAEFELAEYDADSNDFNRVRLFTTSTEKGATFDYYNKNEELKGNTLYRVVETEAPEGYKLDSTPFYFIIKGNIQDVRSGTIALTDLTVSTDEQAKAAAKAPSDIVINMLDPNSSSYFELKNEETPASVGVSKVWDDANNQDGIRAQNVTVELYANDKATGQTKQLNEGTEWAAEFTDLAKTDSAGEPIVYTVEEQTVPAGYTSSVSGSVADGFVITNSHTPETTSVSGTKTWDDANNQDGKRPESITVHLQKAGQTIQTKTVTAADDWSWTFSNLPKCENGMEIRYSVVEDQVEGYTPFYGDEGNYNITNTHTPGKTSVTVEKSWLDNNNQDGIRPSEVSVMLVRNGVDTDKSVVLNADNNWTTTFTDLEEYENGEKVSWSVREVGSVEGYESTVRGDMNTGYTITNTASEKVSLGVEKSWVGPTGATVEVELLADGEPVDSVNLTNENGFKAFFAEQFKYDQTDGHEIAYTVREGDVTDSGGNSLSDLYEAEYGELTNEGVFKILNHQVEKVTIDVDKEWVGLTGKRVEVKLLADGEETGLTVELNDANQWKAMFVSDEDAVLYKYDQTDGHKIEYTVQEGEVVADGNYTSKVTGDAESGFTITNTKVPEKPAEPAEPTKPSKSEEPTKTKKSPLPKTGDAGTLAPMVASFGLVALAIGLRRRRRS